MAKMEVLAVDYSDSEDDDGLVYSYDTPKNNKTIYMNSTTESGHDYPSNNNTIDAQRCTRTSNHISANNNESESWNNSWKPHRKVVSQEQELESVVLEDFRIAIQQGNTSVVKQTLQRGFGVDTVLRAGWTGLMFAVSHGRPAIAQLLLEHGANPNYNKDLLTPLMVACTSKMECEDDLVTCIRHLIDCGARVNDCERHHTTPLMFAAREGHCPIISCLIAAQVELDAQDSKGWTALCWATSRGHGRAVRILLEAGADSMLIASTGQRAVDIAYCQGHNEIADILDRYSSDKQSCSLDPLNSLKYPRSDWLTPKRNYNIVKYEELELFLNGLGYAFLIPLFKEHQVSFKDLLLFTDQDLQQMGINKHGVRKRILDRVQAMHKAKWANSSIEDLKQKKDFTCMDAVAMVRNINKHLCYTQSSILYLRRQIQADPRHLEYGKEANNVKHLAQEAELGLRNAKLLYQELQTLGQDLAKFQDNDKYLPVDLVVQEPRSSRKGAGFLRPLLLSTLLGSLILVWRVKPSRLWLEHLAAIYLPAIFHS